MPKTKAKKKNKGGRPTKYTKALALEICARIAEGQSVRKISKSRKMPNASTIHAWVLDNEEFSKQYARAKGIGADVELDELEEIARQEDDVQRARLIVDTKKWGLSKKMPKKYGDKLDVTSGNKPIPILGGITQKDN